jgi:hypothetical protein
MPTQTENTNETAEFDVQKDGEEMEKLENQRFETNSAFCVMEMQQRQTDDFTFMQDCLSMGAQPGEYTANI